MNAVPATFTDEDLTAYLDGEADSALRQGIESALASDARLEGRLRALDIPLGAMRGALSPAALSAPEMPRNLLPTPFTSHTRLSLVAALALAAALGALGAYMWRPAASPGWMDVVASYQSLYVTETVANANQPPDMTAEVLAGFGSDHGIDLTPAQSVDGLDFKRAQILGFKGKPLLQMAYLSEDDVPFAFCITRFAGEDRGPRTETLEGLSATSWVKDGIGYLVIGGQDDATVSSAASEIIERLG